MAGDSEIYELVTNFTLGPYWNNINHDHKSHTNKKIIHKVRPTEKLVKDSLNEP